jgi:hypothetical protein
MVTTLQSLTDRPPGDMLYSLGENISGQSYENWTVKWWEWFVQIPFSRHPAKDSTGRFGNDNASKDPDVTFLAGAVNRRAEREVNIRAGKPVLVPLLVVENSGLEWPGSEIADLQNLSRGFADDMISLKAVFDEGKVGEAVFWTGLLSKYRVYTGQFKPTFLSDNLFLRAGGQTTASADGYWMFLKGDLFEEKGVKHTLWFRGEGEYYQTEVAYTLNVDQ